MAKKNTAVPSVLKTQASKEYRQLLAEADKTITKYREVVARATGRNKDEIEAEIQAIYLDNLRKFDDPVSLLKENIVALMMKKQTSDFVKEEMVKKALAEAEEQGDIEKIKELEAQMIESLDVSEFDMKFHKMINDSIKAIEASKPRVVNVHTNKYDDNMLFDVEADEQ